MTGGCLLVLAPACLGVFDIFNYSTKGLPGGYCLQLNREFDSYRVQDCSWSGKRNVVEGVGVLEGTIERIGWTEAAIVAWRLSCCGAGDGFMIIDVHSDRIEGPLSETQVEALRRTDPRLRGLQIRPVSEVLD